MTTTVWSCRQVTVMHSMQAGYLEKAQKYTDKALMQLEKLKSKSPRTGLYLAGHVVTAPPGGWPEYHLLCWPEKPGMTAALSSHHESPTPWVLLTQLEDGSGLWLEQTRPSLRLDPQSQARNALVPCLSYPLTAQDDYEGLWVPSWACWDSSAQLKQTVAAFAVCSQCCDMDHAG